MTDRWPMYTVAIMVVFFIAFVGIDIVLLLNNRKGDTYSEVLRKAGLKWLPVIMIFCFGFGLLAGHWWWSPPCP